jgi:hypothetical protein
MFEVLFDILLHLESNQSQLQIFLTQLHLLTHYQYKFDNQELYGVHLKDLVSNEEKNFLHHVWIYVHEEGDVKDEVGCLSEIQDHVTVG